MRAVVLNGERDVSVEEVPDAGVPGPDGLLLRVDRTAICGSDLHLYHGPMTIPGVHLGHEFVGTVEDVGAGVQSVAKGDRVLVSGVIGCGVCPPCRAGQVVECRNSGMKVFGPTGDLTVIDWTGAVLAAPAFDVAFTAMLLANPPLAAPGPLAAVIRFAGARLAGRFVRQYQRRADADLGQLRWYQALHGIRLLLTAATHSGGNGQDPGPFDALAPPAAAAVVSVTGIAVRSSTRP